MQLPVKVLITGGHEVGGLTSFAESLREGFEQLGVEGEVLHPGRIWSRRRELRDAGILKILSTTAVFAAPLAKRAICVAHGFPYPDLQGWGKVVGFIASYKLANACAGAKLVAVSDYLAVHLTKVYNITVDAAIRNAVLPMFEETFADAPKKRDLITYIGRVVPSKGLDRLIPAISDVLEERPDLRACIVGEGESRASLQALTSHNPAIEFRGSLDSRGVRECLRNTRIFVSGNPVEPFGIAYVEALTQGCVVAMPGCGGGIEIAPELVGNQIQLLPISLRRNEVAATLRRALDITPKPVSLPAHSAKAVASAYLELDAGRTRETALTRVAELA